MHNNKYHILTVAVLLILGISLITIRHETRKRSALSPGDSLWRILYDIRINAKEANTKIAVSLPGKARNNRVFKETFSHAGIVMDLVRNARSGTREAVILASKSPRDAMFHAEFDIHVTSTPSAINLPLAPKPLNATDRARYLTPEKNIQLIHPVIREITARLSSAAKTKNLLLDHIFEYCSEELVQVSEGVPNDTVGVLTTGRANTLGRARAMIALCRASGIPARLVSGFLLKAPHSGHPHIWLEAYTKKQWIPFDPENGYARELPFHYAAIRRGGAEIVNARNGEKVIATFAVHKLQARPGFPTISRGPLAEIANLTRLPPGMQKTLSLLLLLPIGALVTSVFRNLIGIRTFGTFTPSLLALSFIYADWRTGLIVFALVMSVALCGRALLTRLRLLMIPRLSLMLTLVILCLTMAVSTLDYFTLTPSAHAVLLPMVIITMAVERFYIRAEEDGIPSALRTLGGTFLVALCCYSLLRIDALRTAAISFPEMHFLTAALLVIIGRYSGYRLNELWRFEAFSTTIAEDGAK